MTRWFSFKADDLELSHTSRHPFQLWVMFACALAGASQLLGVGGQSNSINELLAQSVVLLWAAMMLISTILVLLGSFARDRVYGLLLEKLGLAGLGLTLGIYGAAVAFKFPGTGIITALLCVGVGVAAAFRIRDVNKELRRIKAWREEHLE